MINQFPLKIIQNIQYFAFLRFFLYVPYINTRLSCSAVIFTYFCLFQMVIKSFIFSLAVRFDTRWLVLCAYAVVSFDSVLLSSSVLLFSSSMLPSSSLDLTLSMDDSPVTDQSDIDAAAHQRTWNE